MHLLPRLCQFHMMPPEVDHSFNNLLDANGPTHGLRRSFQLLTYFLSDWAFPEIGVSAQATLALLQLPCTKTLFVYIQGGFDGDFLANLCGTSVVTKFTHYNEITGVLRTLNCSKPLGLEYFIYIDLFMDGLIIILVELESRLTLLDFSFKKKNNVPIQRKSICNCQWPVLCQLVCLLARLVCGEGLASGQQLADALPPCILQLEVKDWPSESDETDD